MKDAAAAKLLDRSTALCPSPYITFLRTALSSESKRDVLEGDADDGDEDGDVEAGDDADNTADEAEDGDGEAGGDAAEDREELGNEAAEDITVERIVSR